MIKKNTKFAIIGAGPAGLSAALHLKKQGYENITVFEKELDFGGKCLSFNHEGRVFDLGANLTTPRYDAIRKLAEELQMTFRQPPERRIVNVGEEVYEDLTQASFLKKSVIKLGAFIYTVFRYFSGIDRQGYANLNKANQKPFRDWLKSHGLGMFQEMFEVLFVAYGYGHVMDLPAAYAMKFFDQHHINAAVNVITGKDVPTTTDFVEGFQQLWKRAVAKENVTVLTGADIKSVTRDKDVNISYIQNSVHMLETFDKVIIACPLQNISFLDVTKEEEELFSKISTYEYYSVVSKVSGLPPVSTYVYPYARKLTPGYPTVFYPPHKDDMYISYAYGGEGVTKDTVKAKLEETIIKLGGKLEQIYHIQKWNYFPHIKSEDMLNGFYDRLEELQGQKHTYYVGEVMSFTLIELIYDYCEYLISEKIVKCNDE